MNLISQKLSTLVLSSTQTPESSIKKGTFEVSGYGERYSNPNGNLTPTVFDFQSYIPGLPSVTSLTITNATLANLRIKVPINEASIPEPASLLGTLMVAGFGIVLKRRKDIGLRKTF
ncbi:PEP-CTERM sorting domain-containing protein [Nostoc sp.]|uniref:PEP-CTERM sorting domain-containing protein n=1 Tax=Nostoc sp. TaxID=1180 RepID=UPI002FF61E4E